MEEKNKPRLDELLGEQVRLQSQCYLMKKGLDVNEIQLGKVVALIAEYGTEEVPKPEPKEDPPDA